MRFGGSYNVSVKSSISGMRGFLVEAAVPPGGLSDILRQAVI